MGTMIELALNNVEIDWGKNRSFINHYWLFLLTAFIRLFIHIVMRVRIWTQVSKQNSVMLSLE